jgi:SsrA-binding protein
MARASTVAKASSNRPEERRKVVATNRKARHDYTVLDVYEAGIALQGTEVKSLRAGHVSLNDAFATITDGEVWLRGLHILESAFGWGPPPAPRRVRKLLLHRAEIARLIGKTRESGLTLVPLSLYFSGGLAKVELALVRGKAKHDKREAMAERDARREAERVVGRRIKGW